MFILAHWSVNIISLSFFSFSGSMDNENVPTLVQELVGHKIVEVDCGSDDAHTLALESNGKL